METSTTFKEKYFFIDSTISRPNLVTLSSNLNLINSCAQVIKLPSLPVRQQTTFVKDASDGLVFSEDVVRERCFHLMPYSDKYFREAIDPSDVVKLAAPVRTPGPMGRMNKPGITNRHMPCIRNKAKKRGRQKLHVSASGAGSTHKKDETFNPPKKAPSRRKVPWDEFLLSQLSKNTANWLVTHKVEAGDPDKVRWMNLVHEWHGRELNNELIKDSSSDVASDMAELDALPEKGKWRQQREQTLLDKVRVGKQSRLPTEENTVMFSRPAVMRRNQTPKITEAEDAVNKSANDITVSRRQVPAPPVLRDHLPPGVGDTVLDITNEYVAEIMTGHRPAFHTDEETITMMDTCNRYRKQLQKDFPQIPDLWFNNAQGVHSNQTAATVKATQVESKAVQAAPVEAAKVETTAVQAAPVKAAPVEPTLAEAAPVEATSVEAAPIEATHSGRIRKGFRRWTGLPNLIDENADFVETYDDDVGDLALLPTNQMSDKRLHRSNVTLLNMLEEWRRKSLLNSRHIDVTAADLLLDMTDTDARNRLKAVLTLSRALEYEPADDSSVQIGERKQTTPIDRVPETLKKALQVLLQDEKDVVRTAAAITLYALKSATPEAEAWLRQKIVCDDPVDRWAAVQCFAHHGICDSDVVQELVAQLMTSQDAVRHEQATYLLNLLSYDVHKSSLVHSMLAENLNSTNWRYKVIVCKTLPVLGGTINKDITQKLTYLMWSDWHNEVRRAAAQCLGRTGHGKDVHDDLIQRLNDPSERVRLEAINRLGYLGIMTGKLLPVFMKRFDDDHVMIREECCIACGNLHLKVAEVVERLVDCASYDPIWRVKALAIQSLSKIGVMNAAVRHVLIWALRYETEAAVRAEACQAIIVMKVMDKQTADILQDRYLVESSPIVQLVIIEALAMFGISPVQDTSTVARVKREVTKLCTKNNIATLITLNDKNDDHKDHVRRYLCPEQAEKEVEAMSTAGMKSHRSSPKTPHHDVPQEITEEDDEQDVYQSRPLTTSSFMSFLSSDMESLVGTTSDENRNSTKSGRKSTAKSGRKSLKSREKSFWHDNEPVVSSNQAEQSHARSTRGLLPSSKNTTIIQQRTPLKFHYIMETIDNFDGLDLSEVIGALRLSATVNEVEQKVVPHKNVNLVGDVSGRRKLSGMETKPQSESLPVNGALPAKTENAQMTLNGEKTIGGMVTLPGTIAGTIPPPETIAGTIPPPETIVGTVPPPGTIAGTIPPPGTIAVSVPPPETVAGTIPPPETVAGTVPPGTVARTVPPPETTADTVPPTEPVAVTVPPPGTTAGTVPPPGTTAGTVPSPETIAVTVHPRLKNELSNQ